MITQKTYPQNLWISTHKTAQNTHISTHPLECSKIKQQLQSITCYNKTKQTNNLVCDFQRSTIMHRCIIANYFTNGAKMSR